MYVKPSSTVKHFGIDLDVCHMLTLCYEMHLCNTVFGLFVHLI